MRDYGKVSVAFWTSATTQSLSDDGKLLALYLLTCPHANLIGCFRVPDGYVSEDLNWPQERVAKGFQELFAKGFCDRCETTKWVLLPTFLKFNPLENPNQRKSAVRLAHQVPSASRVRSGLKAALLTHGGGVTEEDLWPDPSNPSGTVTEPFRNQEQEQEQEQEQDLGSTDPVEPGGSTASSSETPSPGSSGGKPKPANRYADDIHRVFQHWQRVMQHPQAKLDDKRMSRIRDRLKDGYTASDLIAAVDGCTRSPHHMGENDRATRYDDIELICRDAKHVDQFLRLADAPDMTGMSAAARRTATAAQQWLEEEGRNAH